MPKSNHEPKPVEAAEQIPARPHDSGSAANETADGLDATAEALRTPQKIRLAVLVLTMSRKRRYLIGLAQRRKSSLEPSVAGRDLMSGKLTRRSCLIGTTRWSIGQKRMVRFT